MKQNIENYRSAIFFGFRISFFFYSTTLMSQDKGMMGKAGGDMGGGGMVISSAIGIAVIVALVALALFLIRRSKA